MGGIALLTWLSCSPTNDGPSDGSKFKVIAPVVRDTIHTTRYVAEIKAVQNVDVRARIGGFIQTVPVDEGQTVSSTIFSRVSRSPSSKVLVLIVYQLWLHMQGGFLPPP